MNLRQLSTEIATTNVRVVRRNLYTPQKRNKKHMKFERHTSGKLESFVSIVIAHELISKNHWLNVDNYGNLKRTKFLLILNL